MELSGLMLGDRYLLVDQIAAGGMGQVWRASDLLLDRLVAVKLLRPECTGDPETLERFRAEARHAGSLTHPCIAQVYDYGHDAALGSPYLVMELVDGPSLAAMLAAGPVDPWLALDIATQAAAGLDAAHHSGLVHRDIKPGNILVGPGGLVKLTDFGIAYAVDSARITRPGLLIGTAQYIAPERISGRPGTPASDLYSLGIVIYECLAGTPPFSGTVTEVLAGHLYRPLPPLPPGVPPEVDKLVACLAAKDPAARLADASELALVAARLRDGVDGARPTGAWPAGPGRPVLPATAVGIWLPATEPEGQGRTVPGTGPHPWLSRRRAAIAVGTTILAGASLAVALLPGALRGTPDGPHAPQVAPALATKAPAATTPATGGRDGIRASVPSAATSATPTSVGRRGSGRPTTARTVPGSSPSPNGSAGASTKQPATRSSSAGPSPSRVPVLPPPPPPLPVP